MKPILATLTLSILIYLPVLGQDRYSLEIDSFLNQVLLDSTAQSKFGFKATAILEPTSSSNSEYFREQLSKSYNSIANYKRILGGKNPFFKANLNPNKEAFDLAIRKYSYNNSNSKTKIYYRKDSERIFKINYWRQYMDSTGHQTRHFTATERDSMFNEEMKQNWKLFSSEFGDCFVSYEVPIFNTDFSYSYFEWTYACSGNGKGYRGLYKKKNGKWKLIRINEIWSNG